MARPRSGEWVRFRCVNHAGTYVLDTSLDVAEKLNFPDEVVLFDDGDEIILREANPATDYRPVRCIIHHGIQILTDRHVRDRIGVGYDPHTERRPVYFTYLEDGTAVAHFSKD